MRKSIVILMVMSMVVWVKLPAFANGKGAGIVNSPHDFSKQAWNTGGEVCRVCHAPHDEGMTSRRYLNGALWNHDLSSAKYTMYDKTVSTSLDGTVSAQPDGTAKLCLGCHDGTVALDSFDRYAGSTRIDPDHQVPGFTDGTNLDMRGTHPISIIYNNTADRNLRDPNSQQMGTSGTIASLLDHGKVQCSTCHDVHDQNSVANTPLLRAAQTTASGGTASGMCLTCHIK